MNDQIKSPPRGEAGLIAIVVLPEVAKLPVYPLAEEYPMADASEYAGLRESIRQRGVLQPVTLFDDGGLKILDGRNRIKAGLEAGHRWRLEDFRVFVGSLAEAESTCTPSTAYVVICPRSKKSNKSSNCLSSIHKWQVVSLQ